MDITSLTMIGAGASTATYCFTSAAQLRRAGKPALSGLRNGLGAALSLIAIANTAEYILAAHDYGTVLRSAYESAVSDVRATEKLPDPEGGLGSRADLPQMYRRS